MALRACLTRNLLSAVFSVRGEPTASVSRRHRGAKIVLSLALPRAAPIDWRSRRLPVTMRERASTQLTGDG